MHNIVNVLNAIAPYTKKMAKMVNFVLYIFHHNKKNCLCNKKYIYSPLWFIVKGIENPAKP